MDIDQNLGLGRVQRGIVQMALTSGSFVLNGLLSPDFTKAEYNSLHRAAVRLTQPDLRLITYAGGIVSLNDNTVD